MFSLKSVSTSCDDLDARDRLLLKPNQIAVGFSLLIEVGQTHVDRRQRFGDLLRTDDRGTGGYQTLRAVALRRVPERFFDLCTGGDGDAPLVREHERR
jgi:hypothetical protein